MKITFILSVIFLLSLNVLVNSGFADNGTRATIYENATLESHSTDTIIEINETTVDIQNYEKSELDKLFEVMRKDQETQWRQGDVLIASATILAFFGLASFLTVQFRGKSDSDRLDFLKNIDRIMIWIFFIQILQLVTILFIVMDLFDRFFYFAILIMTGIFLSLVLKNTKNIISLQNSGRIKNDEGVNILKETKGEFSDKMSKKNDWEISEK